MKHFYFTLFFIVCFVNFSRAQDEFIFTWQATDAQKELATPTSGTGYDYTIDWGDGTIETNLNGFRSHTYTSNGTYTITIQGTFPAIAFGNNPDFRVPAQLVSIEQWGTNMWTNMTRAFSGCSNLVINATDRPDLSNTTSLEKMFDGTTNLTDNGGELGNWDVSTIENMADMFRNSGMNINIESWNVGNVVNFVGMFTGNTAFNQNINGWNIGEFVTGSINMRAMFDSASSFNSPLNAWDMSKVTNLSSMFGFATAFNQPLDNWDTSSVQNMGGMFFGASDFDQNVGDWNLSSITAMGAMFQLAGLSTTNYDAILIGWATQDIGETIPSNISISFEGSQYCFGTDARNTLTDNTGLNWNIDDDGAACSATDFFTTTWQTAMDNESITIPTTGSGYSYAVDWGDGTVETGFTGDATHAYSTSGTHTVKIIGDFPRIYFNNSGDKDKIISVNQWGAIEWASMESAFYGCTNLTIDASDTPDLTNSTTLRAMFKGATNLVDVQETFPFWNVSTIVDFGQMFMNTDKFNTTLISWNFSVAEDFSEMFRGAKVFNQSLGIPFKAKTFEGMFRDAVAFNQPLFWYTPDVISLKNMFDGATSFDQNLGSFTINSVTDMTGMFTNAGLSTQNYDQTLAGWFLERSVNDTRPNDITFDGGNSQYCLAGDIIEKLTNDHGWQITDSGPGCDESDVFEMTWDLTSENRFTMPTSGNGYDYTLSLSNGEIFYVTSDIVQVSYSENIGMLTVRIYGDFPRFDFDAPFVDKEKLASIEQWGSLQLSEANGAFEGCTNLVLNATDTPDLSQIQFMDRMFENTSSFVDNGGEMNNWDVSTVTGMTGLFEGSAFNENINDWNVSKVEDFSSMFKNNTSFNQPLNNWNTEKANDLTNMFDGATAFNQPIGMWNTALAQYFDFMFLNASAFDQNLGNWDISNTDRDSMDGMLTGSAMSQTNYDATLIGWATLESGEIQIPTDVKLDADTFYCLSETARNTLTNAPYNWTINDLGNSCPEDFFITTWQTITTNESITIPTNGSGYNYIVDWGDGTVETGIMGDVTHTYATAGIQTIKITGDFPAPFFTRLTGDDEGKLLTVEQWGRQQWTSMRSAFDGCYNLKLNAEDTPDLSQVTRMSSMFRDCTNLEDLKDTMNAWDMTTIESISSMFNGCTLFNENIGNWTFTNLKSSFLAFNEATAFNQDISNWNMSTVDDMESMFKNATSFNQPIGNWTLGVVDYINDFFAGATSFNQDLSNWDFSNVYAASDMFNGATAFDQDLSAWDISNVEELDNFFTGSGMSQENYDKTLIGWATLETGETTIPADLTLNADIAHCLSVDAINTLTSAPYNWTINDLGNSCPGDAFITTWLTTTANESITVPTNGSGYNYNIDWGDGTIETGLTANATHQYVTTGTYTVKITGDFPRIYFNNTGDKDKILSVEQWGIQPWRNFQNAFSGCSQLQVTATDAPNLSNVTNLSNMFASCTSLGTPDFSNWNTNTIATMNRMFFRANNFDGNITNWDVGNVTSFEFMFYEAFKFNQNISSWNIGEFVSTKVINMNNMFSTASSFNQPIGSWDLSKVSNIRSMFFRAGAFNQPLNSWDISGMGTLKRLFFFASSFNQPLDSWNVSTISNMDEMFWGASSFNQNLGNWDVSEVTLMNRFFLRTAMSTANYDATLIGWATLETGETQIPANVTLDASSFYCLAEDARNTLTSAPYNWIINDAGKGCPEDFFITTWQTTRAIDFIRIPTDGSGYNYNVDWGDGTIETGFTGNATHTYATAGTYTVKIAGDFPRIRFNSNLVGNQSKIQTIEQWGTQQWDTFSSGFNGCVNLKLNADDVPDLSQVTQLSSMFEGCTNFEDLKDTIGSWDVSTIERIDSMFTACSIFNEDISGWAFTNLIRTDSAFEETFLFNQNISNWNMATVTDMAYMFYDAEAFNQPIGNWTLGKVEYMTGMFSGAIAFNQDLSNWDFSQVQDIEELFSRASSFDQDLSSWDISSVTSMAGIFTDTGLSQANYDSTLIGWANLDISETQIPANIRLDADTTYCLGEAARNTLTSAPYNWTINDGGQGCLTPVITLLGDNPQIIEQGGSYTELGAEVTYGAILTIDATSVNTNQVGNYTVRYDAINNVSGATAVQVTRTVNIVDITAPVITLNGANPQTIELGDGYTELGATSDDGSNIVIDTADFTDAVGSYTIRYNATDASGNVALEVTRTVNVVNNCPLVNLPSDNFTITTSSETCVDKDNGMLMITAATALAYVTTINGENYSFTSSLAVGNLPPGTYPVCIGVEGFTNCEQCFEVAIEAGASLSGQTTLSTDTGKARVAVEITTGTAPYTVQINKVVVGEYTANTFAVEVTHGDEVEVFSSLDCEGKLSTKVNLFDEFRIAPNPTRGDVTLSVPDIGLKTMTVSIYNAIGVKVSSGVYTVASGRVVLPMSDLPQGVYLLSISGGGTFKVVKQ